MRHRGHLARCGPLACILLAWTGLPLAAQAPAAPAAAIDFDKLRDEAARRLSEYLRINTTNPPGNELATARWLKTCWRAGESRGRSSTGP